MPIDVAALPVKGGLQGGENLPAWTVERYAELCIDLQVVGVPRADVLARAGITESQQKSGDTIV